MMWQAKLITLVCLIAVMGALDRIAGKGGFPHAKLYRRYGIGAVLAIFGLCFGVPWYWCVATFATNLVVTSLPITLMGDGIPEHWFNWVWVAIIGFLNALIPFCLGMPDKWLLALLMAAFFTPPIAGMIYISNIPKTAEQAKWEAVELCKASLIAIIAWFIVIGSLAEI